MPLWLDRDPLVLASRSAARRALLEAAGIPLELQPADLDERALEAGGAALAPGAVAQLLVDDGQTEVEVFQNAFDMSR